MFKSFDEIEQSIIARRIRKKIALAGAQDMAALEAVVNAKRKGVVDGILIGNTEEIGALLSEMGESAQDYEIVPAGEEREASETALAYVRDGKADIEMKGKMPSTEYLLPIMNPFDGFLPIGALLSETTAFYYPGTDRMMFATDCALNIAPSLDEKVQLINNAVALARAFGFTEVRVAALSALAELNPKMPSTVEAKALADMDWGEGVYVAGPLALDNALDEVSAREKGVTGPVAGKADVLLLPDICSGNILHKALHFFGHMPAAGVVCGTTKPVVFTSRSDSAETKYNSILSAVLQAVASEDFTRGA